MTGRGPTRRCAACTTAVEGTRSLAGAVAGLCVPGDIVLLAGDLGAGKTAFAQGFGAALGVDEPITSPTFALVRQYPAAGGPIRTLLHADVYRLDHLQEIVDLGLGELVEDGGVAVVEWGDVAEPVLGAGSLTVRIASAARRRSRPRTQPVPTRTTAPSPSPPSARPGTVAGRAWPPPWPRGRSAAVIVLALESATDLVGAALLGEVAPGPPCHRDGRPAPRRGPGSGDAAGCAGTPVCPCPPSTSSPWMSALGCSPGSGWGWPRPRRWARAWASGSWGSRASTSWPPRPWPASGRFALPGGGGGRRPAQRGLRRPLPLRRHRALGTGDPARGRRRSTRGRRFDPEALVDELAGDGDEAGPLVLVGDGAARYQALFDQLAPVGASSRPTSCWRPPPEILARLARLRLQAGAAASDPVDVLPDYLREADATINWEQRVPRPPPTVRRRHRAAASRRAVVNADLGRPVDRGLAADAHPRPPGGAGHRGGGVSAPWSHRLFADELAQRKSRIYRAAWVGPEHRRLRRADAHRGGRPCEQHRGGPGLAGRGIATVLMLDLARAAIDRGSRHLTLEVRVGNEPALALYRRFGMAPVGLRPNYYAETGEDALVMWARSTSIPTTTPARLAVHRGRAAS